MRLALRIPKWTKALAATTILLSVGFAPYTRARAEDEPLLPIWKLHGNVTDALVTNDDFTSLGQYTNARNPICTTASIAANVNTDCEEGVHNETAIAVNPTNPQNMIAGANDYQITLSPGGTFQGTALSRARVTFDGGSTWTTYAIDFHGPNFTGDPSIAFDADGRAYYTTLGFIESQSYGCCTNPDIMVATSADGGRNWTRSSRIAAGSGSSHGVGTVLDKEWVAAWGHGNAIVTWTQFNLGLYGRFITATIMAAVTHDGGVTWSAPTEISGSAPFCLSAAGGTTCNISYVAAPVVAADGSIYVSFLSLENRTNFRDQYLVVKLDPVSGQRVAGPYRVAEVFDGITDYPWNVDGRQTYHDSQFRSWAIGNIAADPTNANHLAVIWSDMRNSVLPTPANPYAADTNSDIIISQSLDGGATWSAPVAIPAAGDQFMPWGVYDAGGRLRVGYFDRSYDPANHMYGYTLATENAPISLNFSTAQVTTALSDPTQHARFFAVTVNSAFPRATRFLGDYSNLAVIPGGGIAALWTDMRLQSCFGVRCGSGSDAFFATTP